MKNNHYLSLENSNCDTQKTPNSLAFTILLAFKSLIVKHLISFKNLANVASFPSDS